MARYGALYPVWAPIQTDTTSAAPTYDKTKKQTLGELVKVTETPNFAEATQYGDNRAVEYVNMFKDCDLDTEETDLSMEQAAALYGAALATDDVAVTYKTGDSAPYGGFGFVSCKIRNGVKSYIGVWYSKVKAIMQASEHDTRNDSITLGTDKVKFKAIAPNGSDEWKDTKSFADEAAAKSWLDGKISAT